MGPYEPHLTERVPRNRVFKRALSYRTYRLKNVDQSFQPRQADRLGDYQKRLKVTLYAPLFSGEEEIEVLNFLTQYKRACDDTGISEGIALRLFRFNLKGVALAGQGNPDPGYRRCAVVLVADAVPGDGIGDAGVLRPRRPGPDPVVTGIRPGGCSRSGWGLSH